MRMLLQINLPVVAAVILLAGVIVFWMVRQNKRDRRQLENKLSHDYRPPRDDKADPDPEPPMK